MKIVESLMTMTEHNLVLFRKVMSDYCLQRTHQLVAIGHTLQGADYTIGQSGFTQLYNNANLVAELLGVVENVSFPICRFRKSLAVLLFQLTNDDIINEEIRRDRKGFTRIMLKEHKLKSKFTDLSARIAKVSGIKCKTFGTTKRYAFSFYETIKWYSRCIFLNSTFWNTKVKRCLSIHFIKQPSSKMI